MKESLEQIAYDYATNKTKFRKDVLKEVGADNYVSRHADCMEDFQCGYNKRKEESTWISVEERLPEKDGLRVWVKSSCLNEQPLVYWQGKFYARLSDGCYDGSVTHWMPIPE